MVGNYRQDTPISRKLSGRIYASHLWLHLESHFSSHHDPAEPSSTLAALVGWAIIAPGGRYLTQIHEFLGNYRPPHEIIAHFTGVSYEQSIGAFHTGNSYGQSI